MKILFIAGFRSDILARNGVSKKINLEIKTFQRLGNEVDFLEFVSGRVYLIQNGNRVFLSEDSGSFYSVMNRVYLRLHRSLRTLEIYDLVYVRYEYFGFPMIRFFRAIKRVNKKTKIVGEMPTFAKYPPTSTSLKRKVFFYIKRVFSLLFNENIDLIATFSNHRKIFNVSTVNIENFVDFDTVKIRSPSENDVLDILAVAQLAPQHGYDRLIKGLKIYYELPKAAKVIFHVVGDGSEKKKLEELSFDLGLDEDVKFYGSLGGSDLDRLFDLADIGVGSLASFRRGVQKASDLKIREYAARGLPFIYTAEEPQLEGFFFAKKIPFDETPVNIKDIVDFHNSLKMTEHYIVEKMRGFAEREFACETQLSKILDRLDRG